MEGERMEPGTKSQREEEGRREWNGEGPLARKGALYFYICVPQFLVTPLRMGRSAYLAQPDGR